MKISYYFIQNYNIINTMLIVVKLENFQYVFQMKN